MLDSERVEGALLAAAIGTGSERQEAIATIRSGIEAGSRHPREIAAPKGVLEPTPRSIGSGFHEGTWPELGLEALHGFVGQVIEAIGPHTEADPVAIVGQLLAAFGSALGRNPHVNVESDRHGGNLFVALVGETSKGRKGTSWAHVRNLTSGADETWSSLIVNGLSSGEGLIYAIRDPLEKQQPIKDPKTRKIIGYDLVVEDVGEADKRLLVVETELASVLKVGTREGNTLSPVLRSAWDGTTLRTLTRNSPLRAGDPHVSLIGHITRAELTRHLSDTEAANGLGNRVIWLCARRSKVLPEGGRVDPAIAAELTDQLRNILAISRGIGELRRDPEASEIWRAVYPGLSEGRPGLLGAITGRAEAQVTRLAMLYALLDTSAVIRQEHLLAALALWNYADQSAQLIFGSRLGDPIGDAIMGALRSEPNGLTRTDIYNLFGRHKSAALIERTLAMLQGLGLVWQEQRQSAGRSAEVWLAV
jgi:hypothetical protein